MRALVSKDVVALPMPHSRILRISRMPRLEKLPISIELSLRLRRILMHVNSYPFLTTSRDDHLGVSDFGVLTLAGMRTSKRQYGVLEAILKLRRFEV